MGLNPVAVCYNEGDNNTIQYNTIPLKYNTVTHITHNNIQHSRRHCIRKITKKKSI